uniref:Metal transporter CNNM4 n=1 Tax=Aceria tosichella TaxID=561515 RepID=A0A6G1SG17_9ACAR
MARTLLMSNTQLTTTLLFGPVSIFIVIIITSSIPPGLSLVDGGSGGTFTTTTTTAHTPAATGGLIQPVLTGFRCEGYNEVTSDGVVIIEADSHVKVTLFGEYFTTDTIVGFTTQFVPHVDVVDQMISKNEISTAKNSSTTTTPTSKTTPNESNLVYSKKTTSQKLNSLNVRTSRLATQASLTTTDADNTNNPNNNQTILEQQQSFNSSVDNNSTRAPQRLLEPIASPRSAPQQSHQTRPPLTEAEIKLRRHRRRLLDSRSYDCTDYDRVKSYKLSEENIITPNVAVLTIKLPELGSLSSTGMYYYFCLKQPPIPSKLLELEDEAAAQAELEAAAAASGHDDDGDDEHTLTALSAFPKTELLSTSSQTKAISRNHTIATKHIWVHQGDEWWLMIKVEPPILSIANDCVLIVLLLFLSAVTSGLNLGLMSLDMNELAVISTCGDQRERSYARTIAPLRKRGNYLLCSLLLGNVMVNSTLTVILEEMTSGVVAVIGSTLAIVVLGEIVPQAFCARQGLAIGAKTIYLTYAFMIITFPLSYPISCLLDCILGAEKGHVYDREKLMEFIKITGNHTQLDPDEVAIISGALKLKKIRVDQIMTKLEDVFMLPIDCMLDRKTIRSIIEKGYSRIPVYEFGDRRQIVALILAKDLALLDPDDQMPLANMLMYCKHPLIFIEDTATLDVALNEFKTGKSHMAIVRQIYDDGEVDKYYEAIGVVTLEDVIEEVLQTEINDETDTLSDNRRKRRRTDAQVAHLVDELILENPTKLK